VAKAELPPAGSRTARMLPGRPVPTLVIPLVTMLLGVIGCGHATVPCPTPTVELDRLRAETDRVREDSDKAQGEEGAWEARKEAAAQRVRDIEARLDSLAAARSR